MPEWLQNPNFMGAFNNLVFSNLRAEISNLDMTNRSLVSLLFPFFFVVEIKNGFFSFFLSLVSVLHLPKYELAKESRITLVLSINDPRMAYLEHMHTHVP